MKENAFFLSFSLKNKLLSAISRFSKFSSVLLSAFSVRGLLPLGFNLASPGLPKHDHNDGGDGGGDSDDDNDIFYPPKILLYDNSSICPTHCKSCSHEDTPNTGHWKQNNHHHRRFHRFLSTLDQCTGQQYLPNDCSHSHATLGRQVVITNSINFI